MGNEINIKKLFILVRKRIWILIVTTIIFSALGTVYSTYLTKPLYESSSRMIVNANPEQMTTLMVMIKDPSFLENVVKEMGLNRTSDQLSQQISAGSIGNSAIVKISVVDTNPKLAAQIANTTASVFKREVPKLLGFGDIKILSEANINLNPINNNPEKKILLSFLVGMIAGIGLIFLLDFLDNTIRSERYAEQILGFPVLGSVSRMNKKNISNKKSEKVKKKVEIRSESLGTSK